MFHKFQTPTIGHVSGLPRIFRHKSVIAPPLGCPVAALDDELRQAQPIVALDKNTGQVRDKPITIMRIPAHQGFHKKNVRAAIRTTSGYLRRGRFPRQSVRDTRASLRAGSPSENLVQRAPLRQAANVSSS